MMPFHDEAALVPPAADTLPINLAVLDGEGTILFTNRAWREFGRENDIAVRPSAVGVNYLDITEQADEETARTVAAGLRELLAGERDLLEVEYPCHSPDERRWFLMRAAPFERDGERFVAVAHIDITDRVEAERDLARFERAVETAGQAVFLANADGEITYVNPAFEEITGYGAREAIGRSPRLLKSEETDEDLYEDLWGTVTAGEIWEGTLVNRRKSGELYYAHETIAPVVVDGELVEFVAVQTDVTELRERRKQVEKLENVLRHDLRNRLNVVQGYADRLREGRGTTDENVEGLSEAVSRLLETVEKGQRLQSFLSRTTSPSPRDVVPVVEAVVAELREEFPAAEITLEAPEEATGLAVAELSSAVGELVRNGVVHNESDRPRVEVTVERTDDWVDVRVADNGSGIPEMEYESLESDAVSQLYHDTGFGLNLVYWIARRSGGRLLVDEREPDGVVATVRIPRAEG